MRQNLQESVISFIFVLQVGDGTTSVVLLAGEFLKQVKPFVEEGVHPRIVIRALRKATQLAIEKIHEIEVKVSGLTTIIVPHMFGNSCHLFVSD